jgi:fluoroacetyl-CoA thioesterase
MNDMIPLNITSTKTTKVEKAHTAAFIGSGDLEVLATPMLIALMENAAMDTVQDYLEEGKTTVGSRVDVEHLRPTSAGEDITAEATLEKREGHMLEFWVTARDRFGMIGQGKHIRYIVDRKKFMEKAGRKA